MHEAYKMALFKKGLFNIRYKKTVHGYLEKTLKSPADPNITVLIHSSAGIPLTEMSVDIVLMNNYSRHYLAGTLIKHKNILVPCEPIGDAA